MTRSGAASPSTYAAGTSTMTWRVAFGGFSGSRHASLPLKMDVLFTSGIQNSKRDDLGAPWSRMASSIV